MSYQDFNNGYNGNYSGTPDAGSNESFRRGVFQAQDDARNAELNDFISKGGLNGFGSGSGGQLQPHKKLLRIFLSALLYL